MGIKSYIFYSTTNYLTLMVRVRRHSKQELPNIQTICSNIWQAYLYTPSTIIKIFFQGLRVRGCPVTIASLSFFSKSSILLCLNTLVVAPDNLWSSTIKHIFICNRHPYSYRHPRTSEAWLSTSLRMRHPLLTRQGMFIELVAKPIPKQRHESTPIYSATDSSNFSWISKLPAT